MKYYKMIEEKERLENIKAKYMDNILKEAEKCVYSDRNESYGHPSVNFENIANMWSVILKTKVTPQQVGLCMVATKIARQMHSPKRDNLVDIAGYAATLDRIETGE